MTVSHIREQSCLYLDGFSTEVSISLFLKTTRDMKIQFFFFILCSEKIHQFGLISATVYSSIDVEIIIVL